MNFKEKYGPTALIAGASEGLGAAYARALAARGLDLVMVARRKEVLEATAAAIATRYGVRVLPITCDLAAPEAIWVILDALGDRTVDFLVYNAALSYIGPYLSTNLSTHTDIVSVNATAPLVLLHHFGREMIGRKRGGIVIMSSLAGFQGSGGLATYAATKAFCRVLAEGLWYEWKPLGVDVIACCAGSIATPNYLDTRPAKASALEPAAQQPEAVAEECLRRIGRGPSFVSGRGNRWVAFLMQRLMTRKAAVTMMGDALKRTYGR
ncbi:MAG TPA: SDR family NAD(P)-dependent oxidoreductase [Dinghuibacter sp.]|jgi:short-subunit dehydrogenase|uniref:SDR family NAD(P)-dependent oxidoreductase n=1 Tax=Dinghuibacter sp. TaxID=2024697 RepID=UPI002C6108DB|nr:SDR family NAD(P)-dependent oxidoreductase [Dinghuibacter sp.]HTJ13320.1 SDR family NAD(P)-dependent oxidoreductase [Dinghuibacter sp.]